MTRRVKEEQLLLQNGSDHIHDFSLPRLGKQSRRSKSGDETLFASKKKILEHSLQIRYQFCQTPLLAPTGALNRWPLAIVQYPLDNIQQCNRDRKGTCFFLHKTGTKYESKLHCMEISNLSVVFESQIQIPLSAEACLWLTPKIQLFCHQRLSDHRWGGSFRGGHAAERGTASQLQAGLSREPRQLGKGGWDIFWDWMLWYTKISCSIGILCYTKIIWSKTSR